MPSKAPLATNSQYDHENEFSALMGLFLPAASRYVSARRLPPPPDVSLMFFTQWMSPAMEMHHRQPGVALALMLQRVVCESGARNAKINHQRAKLIPGRSKTLL